MRFQISVNQLFAPSLLGACATSTTGYRCIPSDIIIIRIIRQEKQVFSWGTP